MTIAVKGKEAKTIDSHVPFIITSNKLPDFRGDEKNVERRLWIFKIKPLPKNLQCDGVLEIFREQCMNYYHWMGLQITKYRHLIEDGELFYESIPGTQVTSVEEKRTSIVHKLRNTAKRVREEDFRSNFADGADGCHPVSNKLKSTFSGMMPDLPLIPLISILR